MSSPKKLGGPNTLAGKLKVSKNATKHGLSTMQASNDSEQALIDQFSQELHHFYKPENPLEIFQIQRIAICRAKLARLYEVESVRLQLAKKALLNDQQKIIEQLSGVGELTKGMLTEQLRYGECTLPCGLEAKALESIAAEITHFSGCITNEHLFARSFPALTKYLHSLINNDEEEKVSLEKKLLEVSARLEEVFKNGDKYYERLRSLLKGISTPKQTYDKSAADDLLDELDQHQNRSNAQRAAQYPGLKKSTPAPPPPKPPSLFENHEQVRPHLEAFTRLWNAYRQLEGAQIQYDELLHLLLQATTLPTPESDLFMRYQTTLERRLSGAIGELLELQKLKS